MRIIIFPSANQVADFCAQTIADAITQKPNTVIGLATGSTPVASYQKLIKKHNEKNLSFAKVRSFNLDEYIGLETSHPQSYHYFMNQQLFNHIDINPENTHLPDGLHNDFSASCIISEEKIKKCGGIDLQILGIGENGHIGFNEPTSSLSSRTRVKTLSAQTIASNGRFFDQGETQPELSITMGIGTIMESKKILLLATGEQKKQAVAHLVEGPVSAFHPASILQMHKNAMIIIDESAASLLQLRDYYLYVEQRQNTINQGA